MSIEFNIPSNGFPLDPDFERRIFLDPIIKEVQGYLSKIQSYIGIYRVGNNKGVVRNEIDFGSEYLEDLTIYQKGGPREDVTLLNCHSSLKGETVTIEKAIELKGLERCIKKIMGRPLTQTVTEKLPPNFNNYRLTNAIVTSVDRESKRLGSYLANDINLIEADFPEWLKRYSDLVSGKIYSSHKIKYTLWEVENTEAPTIHFKTLNEKHALTEVGRFLGGFYSQNILWNLRNGDLTVSSDYGDAFRTKKENITWNYILEGEYLYHKDQYLGTGITPQHLLDRLFKDHPFRINQSATVTPIEVE